MKWDLRRTVRYYYYRFIRLQGSPFSLALGAGIGAAIAITPTLPFHTVMIVGTTLMFRANTIAALIVGTIISNPLTFAGQYYLSWKIGDLILPNRLSWERLEETLNLIRESSLMEGLKIISQMGLDATLVLQTGGIVLAIPLGIGTYIFSYRFFVHIREKRRQKHLLK